MPQTKALNGQAPTFTFGTQRVFKVQLVKVSGNDYFFKIIAIDTPGEKADIYVNGKKLFSATVGSANNNVICDTTTPFNLNSGNSYIYKLTAKTKPVLVCGNGSVFTVSFAGQKGNNYFYKAKAVGKAGDCAGFYINGYKVPCTIATIL